MFCLITIWIAGYALTIIGMLLHERKAPPIYFHPELVLLLFLPVTWPIVLFSIVRNACRHYLEDFSG